MVVRMQRNLITHSLAAGSNEKWQNHSGKVWQFHIELNMQLSYDLGNTLIGIYPRVIKT